MIVTDANNCSKQSECVYVLVSGYGFVVSGYEFSIYPNPTDGEITVVLRPSFDKLKMTTINITDALGRIIILDKTNLKANIYNLTAFSSGVYFVKVVMSDGSFSMKKFVKE